MNDCIFAKSFEFTTESTEDVVVLRKPFGAEETIRSSSYGLWRSVKMLLTLYKNSWNFQD